MPCSYSFLSVDGPSSLGPLRTPGMESISSTNGTNIDAVYSDGTFSINKSGQELILSEQALGFLFSFREINVRTQFR